MSDNTTVSMVIKKNTTEKHGYENERSMDCLNIDIQYDSVSKRIEANLYGIGLATICIVDSLGNIVDESFADTSIPSTVYLSSTSCSIDFFIIVYSDVFYAEGYVEQ